MYVRKKRNKKLAYSAFMARAHKRAIAAIVIVMIAFAACISYAFFKKERELNPVLFVHGYTANSDCWSRMIDKFVSDGWPREMLYAYTFSDCSNCSTGVNAKNAEEIAEWVEQILAETGAKKVDIVAHSMGGLSSRYYIKLLGGIDKVDDYVCLATPQHGAIGVGGAGEMKADSAFIEKLNDGDETPGGVLPDTEGWRDDPAGEGGYNGAHVPGNITWTAICSKTDAIVIPLESAMLDGAVNLERSMSHSSFLTLLDEQPYEWVKAAIE